MITDYFGAMWSGRLRSMAFLGRWILVVVAFFAALLAIGAAIGLGERIAGGDVAALEDEISRNFGFAAVAVLALVFLAGFALINVTAKRARDAGLPGWPTAFAVAIVAGVSGQIAGRPAMGAIVIVALIILTVLPTDMLRGK